MELSCLSLSTKLKNGLYFVLVTDTTKGFFWLNVSKHWETEAFVLKGAVHGKLMKLSKCPTLSITHKIACFHASNSFA